MRGETEAKASKAVKDKNTVFTVSPRHEGRQRRRGDQDTRVGNNAVLWFPLGGCLPGMLVS